MNLKSTCVWKENFKADIDNQRGHTVAIDLPEDKGGNNSAAMALELTVMSLAGCIVTIFTLLAKKMKIDFSALSCDIDAEKPEGTPSIAQCNAKVKIKSASEPEKIKLCLEKAVKICPVGVIFEKAGIKVTYTLRFTDN
jgi:putative redox protein